MTRSRLFALWLIVCLFVPSGAGVATDRRQQEEAEALFERARGLCDLQAEGGAPFRLEALVHVRVEQGVAEGHYIMLWQSKERWRDELTFPRYRQVRVSTESAVWRLRNTNHQPLPVLQFLQGFFGAPLDARKGWKPSISELQEEGSVLKCASLRHDSGMLSRTLEFCFDSASGILVRQTWSEWDTTWKYSDYFAWNGKLCARTVYVLQGEKVVGEARITSLVAAPNLDPAIFTPPNGAEEWPRCEDERPATPASSDLVGPDRTRPSRPAFTPVLIEIGADGRVQDAVFLRPLPDPELEHTLFVHLKQESAFQPARCGKAPVPSTMVIELPL